MGKKPFWYCTTNKWRANYPEWIESNKLFNPVSIEEISRNNYSLNIPQYVDAFEDDEAKLLIEIIEEVKEIDMDIKEA